jgi:hypothetical protein
MEQGMTIIPSVANEPLESEAAMSPILYDLVASASTSRGL